MTALEMKDYMCTKNYQNHMPHVAKAIKYHHGEASANSPLREYKKLSDLRSFNNQYGLKFEDIVAFCEDEMAVDYKILLKKVRTFYTKNSKEK